MKDKDPLVREKKVKVVDDSLSEQYAMDDVKMVLVVREDLKMGKGKIGA